MARRRIPDALEMRRLKYGAHVDLAARDAMAKTLRADGRLAEAILLFESRPDHPELETDLATAVREGMSFHVLALRRMGTPVSDEKIRACAVAAEAKSRWFDAHRCYTALADVEGLARVAQHLPGFQVAVPANKV
jgi:hypothetical protein